MAANAITVAGNLVKDPELAATKKGGLVLSFRVGVDDAGGKDTAGFFTCQAWGISPRTWRPRSRRASG
jgi:single-stranded DNA-binding protein